MPLAYRGRLKPVIPIFPTPPTFPEHFMDFWRIYSIEGEHHDDDGRKTTDIG